MNIFSEISFAARGYILWKMLKLSYKIKNRDIVLFLIEKDDELNECAIKYLKNLLERKFCDKYYVISPYNEVLSKISDKGNTILISDGDCERIKKYYQLVKFSDNVYFITMTWPQSNWVYRMLGKNGISKKEIICLGIYKLNYVPNGEVCKL